MIYYLLACLWILANLNFDQNKCRIEDNASDLDLTEIYYKWFFMANYGLRMAPQIIIRLKDL